MKIKSKYMLTFFLCEMLFFFSFCFSEQLELPTDIIINVSDEIPDIREMSNDIYEEALGNIDLLPKDIEENLDITQETITLDSDPMTSEIITNDVAGEEYDAINSSDIPASIQLGVKETFALQYAENDLKFVSSSPTVATVNKKGVIFARRIGKTTIAIYQDKKKVGVCKVSVLASPKKITLSDHEIDIFSLSFSIWHYPTRLVVNLPKNTASQITWSSSNTKVATVDENGDVCGWSEGVAKITAMTFNGKKDTCIVYVVGGNIPIKDRYFPDKSFREYVERYDKDANGILSENEREAVKKMAIKCKAKSLEGLQFFPKIQVLVVVCPLKVLKIGNVNGDEWIKGVFSELSQVDISGCSDIEDFALDSYFGDWNFTSFKLGGKKALKNFSLDHVTISQLNIIGFDNLESINVIRCQVDSLTADNCPKLDFLDCRESHIKKLNLSQSATPMALACSNNELTTIDLQGRSKLYALWCDNNQLKRLFVNNCTNLNQLDCSNNKLKKLNLKGCKGLKSEFGIIKCDSNVKLMW